MRCTSKSAFLLLLAGFAATAQKPVGVTGFVGAVNDYWALHTNTTGDAHYFQAWAANSMLSLFPDPTGLPVLGTVNDGSTAGCSGNIELIQLSRLANPLTTPTTGNTLVTALPCLTSFGTSPGDIGAPSGTWAGHLTGGDVFNSGTWKGVVTAFRNGILLAPFYRQTAAGDAYGDATLVLSPDVGQTWVDYGRYKAYTVTGASCTSTTATLTVANALSAGQKIYVHDVGVPYNGKQTVATATGSQVTYAVSTCVGATGSVGYFGLLTAGGSAPLGPSDGSYPADIMWPVSGGKNPMVQQTIVNYGQDGSYPSGIESACDPTVWVCGLAVDLTQSPAPTILWRVPVGEEMDKTQYRWYACTGYASYWAVAETVCDGNVAGTWTSTLANATPLFNTPAAANAGSYPGPAFSVTFSSAHGSYVLSTSVPLKGKISYRWAPHPWGPWYIVGHSECSSSDGITCNPSFQSLMGYGENIISTTPPKTQIRLSTTVWQGTAGHSSAGNPSWWTVEAASGRVPVTAVARRADFMGGSGQFGMGHRFASGNEAGAISRRGLTLGGGTYLLDWWTDLWDHGGDTGTTARPYFRDVISGGAKYFIAYFTDGGVKNAFGQGLSLQRDGVRVPSGYDQRLQSTFNDSVFSASSGNNSWTFVSAFNITTPSGTGVQNEYGRPIPILGTNGGNVNTSVDVYVGSIAAGDVCVQWGGKYTTNPTSICTAGSTISPNTWYFLAVSAKANGSGFPTITMYLGSAGALTEYGGISMATSPDNTTLGGLTKKCPTYCSTTPSVVSGAIDLGHDASGTTESLNGTFGEGGVYSGVVPSHAIREIYRTLKTDWARVGRGTL